MGVITLNCITTDPDSTTYYGFAYATSYAPRSNYPDAVLVKSNPNPASPANLTWSVVSRINAQLMLGVYDTLYAPESECIVVESDTTLLERWIHNSMSKALELGGISQSTQRTNGQESIVL